MAQGYVAAIGGTYHNLSATTQGIPYPEGACRGRLCRRPLVRNLHKLVLLARGKPNIYVVHGAYANVCNGREKQHASVEDYIESNNAPSDASGSSRSKHWRDGSTLGNRSGLLNWPFCHKAEFYVEAIHTPNSLEGMPQNRVQKSSLDASLSARRFVRATETIL
jgi:hypothetical protein